MMRVKRWPAVIILALASVWAASHAQEQKRAATKSAIRLIPRVTISGGAPAGGDFGEIVGLALDGQGALYVCDGKAGNVRKFDASGVFVGAIGKAGSGPGEFVQPADIEVTGDRLFVLDLGGPRVSVFDLDGKFLSSVPVDDKEGDWRRFRALPDGRFIVETEFIDRVSANAVPEMRLALHAADFSRLKTVFRKPVRWRKLVTEPVRMNVLLPFAPAVEWDLTPEGMIAVGSSGNYEIEIIDPDRGKIRSWSRPFVPVEITERDREEYLAGLALVASMGAGFRSGRVAPEKIAKHIEFPKTKPAFERFMVNGRGRIWTFLTSADPKANPVFEAFDPDGTFRGRVILGDEWPPSAPVVFFVGGVWMAAPGANGRTEVVRYQITS